MTDEFSKHLAFLMMDSIAYDNGFFDRWHPAEYSIAWVNKLAPVAKHFFESNFDQDLILHDVQHTEELIDNICNGEHSENIDKYSSLVGYEELSNLLNEYFDDPGIEREVFEKVELPLYEADLNVIDMKVKPLSPQVIKTILMEQPPLEEYCKEVNAVLEESAKKPYSFYCMIGSPGRGSCKDQCINCVRAIILARRENNWP